jgi:hypothetical protein
MWSVSLSTDWRIGQNELGPDPWSFLQEMARKTNALVAVDSGRAPGYLRHLVPGIAARAFGLSEAQKVYSEGDAGLDPAPFHAVCVPVRAKEASDQSDRLAQAERALIALLHDTSLGPVLPSV